MTADLHTLTGAYAAHALDRTECEQFEAHLRECSACRDEVAELMATTARLADGVATAPPPELRARVLAEVAATRQLSPESNVTYLSDRRPWYRQPATVAASLLLVTSTALGGVALNAAERAEDAERQADLIASIATDPERVTADAQTSAGGIGTVVAAHGAALFRTQGLAPLPEDRVYQLWVIRSEGAESAGVLGRGGELEALVEDMSGADSLGVTVEPAGGSASPTGPMVLNLRIAA